MPLVGGFKAADIFKSEAWSQTFFDDSTLVGLSLRETTGHYSNPASKKTSASPAGHSSGQDIAVLLLPMAWVQASVAVLCFARLVQLKANAAGACPITIDTLFGAGPKALISLPIIVQSRTLRLLGIVNPDRIFSSMLVFAVAPIGGEPAKRIPEPRLGV